MKRLLSNIAILSTAVLITSGCGGSSGTFAVDQEFEEELIRVIDDHDDNGDDMLSSTELSLAYIEAFEILDADGDGDFDADDYGMPVENMEAFDPDLDGTVSKEDFVTTSTSLAHAESDLNQDGVITEEEALIAQDDGL